MTGIVISYEHSARLKVGMWLSAAAFTAFVYLYQSFFVNAGDALVVRLVPIGILIACWAFFLRKSGVGTLADEVSDLGDRLQFRRGKMTETILLSRIATIKFSKILSLPVIEVSCIEAGSLGQKIPFLPIYHAGSHSWSEARVTAAVARLNNRVMAARSAPET